MYDLDAAYAAQREAAREPFMFTYGGETFEVPLSDTWPLEASTLIANGDLVGGLALILNASDPEQAENFMAHAPKLGHVKLILEEEAKHENVGGLPNSGASRRRVLTPT